MPRITPPLLLWAVLCGGISSALGSAPFAPDQPAAGNQAPTVTADTPRHWTWQDGARVVDDGIVLAWFGVNEPPARDHPATSSTTTLSPESAALRFLARHAERFGGEAAVAGLELAAVKQSPHTTHVCLRQTAGGIPVYHGEVRVHLDEQRAVTAVTTTLRFIENTPQARTGLSADGARQRAAEIIGAPARIATPRADQMVFVDNDGEARIAWVVNYPCADPLGDWELVLDASNGTPLHLGNRLAFLDGEGMTFNPDPLTTAEADYNDPGFSDNNDADSPQLNAERVSVVLRDIAFHGNLYWLEGPYVAISDFEAPMVAPVSSATPDGFHFTRSQSGFEDVSAYYHIDTLHRRLRALGFMDLQDGPIPVDTHGMNGADNSYYSPELNRIAHGEGGVDDAEDADVIWHEYGHALHHDAAGGELWGFDVSAISEGLSDYWAASMSARLSDYHRDWYANWDGHNEFWGGRSVLTDTVYPDGWGGNIHDSGTIWANALWVIHEQVDADVADALVAQSLYYLTPEIPVTAAADAVLQAENDLYAGQYHDLVHEAFELKGFLYDSGTLAGTLTDEVNGDPVEGVEITVHAEPVMSADSGPDGQYVVGHVPVGSWEVDYYAAGYAPASATAEIELNGTTTLDLELIPGVATVNVDSLTLHAYIGDNVDTSFAITSLEESLYYLLRAEPVGLDPVQPFTPVDLINPMVPVGGTLQDVTFLDGDFYVLYDNPPSQRRVYVLNRDGFAVRSFPQPVENPPLRGLTTDGTNLYSIDGTRIVKFDPWGDLLDVLTDLAAGYEWVTYDPVMNRLWCATENGAVAAYEFGAGLQNGPFETGLTLNGLAFDEGREDRYALVLLENDGDGAPEIQLMHPDDGTLSDEFVPLYPFQAAETSGGAVFTGLQPAVDYRYFVTFLDSGSGPRLQLYGIRWTIPWLGFEPQFSHLVPNQTEMVAVHAASGELDTGDYEGVIRLFFPLGGQSLEIPFTLRVTSVNAPDPDPAAAKAATLAVSMPSPNPCNAATSFMVTLPHAGELTMTVYDLLGREVVRLNEGRLSPGTHTLTFDAGNLASGMYFVQARANGQTALRKVVVVK